MPGGITCSVMSCKNNSTTARKMGKPLGFFTFPKDFNVRKEWVNRCNRKENWNPGSNSSRICSDHFQISDFEDLVKARMLNVNPKRLKSDAIPSLYLQAPKLEVSEVVEDIKADNFAEWNKVLTLESEENQLGSSAVHTMTNLKFVTKLDTEEMSDLGNVIDTSVSLSDINQRCRLCLEMSLPLFAFESVVTFDDGSTLDVYQTFQKITRESDEQMRNKKYPAHLCMSCLKLLVSANNFHEKYQKSLITTEEMLCQDSGKVKKDYLDVPEKIDISELKLEDTKNNQVELATSGPLLHKCPICRESFAALDLKKHCWEHSVLKSYLHAAPKHRRKVKFFAHPKSTMSIFNVDNPTFTCSFCPEELDTSTYFEHLAEHEKLGNFKCQICDRTFAAKNRLFVHQRSHKEEEAYQCPKPGCGKRFFKKDSFNNHTAKHTDLNDLPFGCSACSKAFANPQDLKRHILNHETSTKEKQDYFCSTCRKTFNTRRGFRYHPCCKKQMLPSKSLVLCYVCGKRVLNMHKHMKAHASREKQKERTYMCSHCGKLFGQMSHLCNHVKCLHTNEATNNCQYCSKEFKDANELKMHKCTNAAVRQFVCDLCYKRFTERRYLTGHRKRAHPELFYSKEEINLDS